MILNRKSARQSSGISTDVVIAMDAFTEEKALAAMAAPDLRANAILALGTVGTTAAFATLLAHGRIVPQWRHRE